MASKVEQFEFMESMLIFNSGERNDLLSSGVIISGNRVTHILYKPHPETNNSLEQELEDACTGCGELDEIYRRESFIIREPGLPEMYAVPPSAVEGGGSVAIDKIIQSNDGECSHGRGNYDHELPQAVVDAMKDYVVRCRRGASNDEIKSIEPSSRSHNGERTR